MNSRIAGWLILSAFAGGALSALVGVLVLLKPDYYTFRSPWDLLVVAVEGAALLAVLGGLFGLHLAQKDRYGGLGRAGFYISSAGLVMAGMGHLIALPFFVFVDTGGIVYVLIGLSQGIPLVWGAIYILGTLLLSAGVALLGAATLRARKLPLWSGPVLIAGLAGLWTLGNAGGWISFGIAWILVARSLRSGGERETKRPARVS